MQVRSVRRWSRERLGGRVQSASDYFWVGFACAPRLPWLSHSDRAEGAARTPVRFALGVG